MSALAHDCMAGSLARLIERVARPASAGKKPILSIEPTRIPQRFSNKIRSPS
ncbi:hypothetical protein SBC1_06260 [Caballeronia sp. SBC1]|nr:hypothetical protein SBC1_06260 [Caballeronia sp. SBC1]